MADAVDLAVHFDWQSAPLSDVRAPIIAGLAYVALVLFLQRAMRSRGGFQMRLVQAVHNLLLSALSFSLFAGTLIEVVKRTSQAGGSGLISAQWMFCEARTTQPRGPLWFMSYLYYLSKYYELLDTVLQLLKGRPPPHFFLNVYHHAVVLLMAWCWVEYVQSLSFIGLLFNTSVHVVMYYYYFLRVMGWQVWWKRYVTKFQIVQFTVSAACYVVTLSMLAAGFDCAGTRVLVFNFLFNMTLLYQFVGVMREGRKNRRTD